MWFQRSFLLALLAMPVQAATHQQAFAQQKAAPKAAPKPAPIAPAAPLKDGWEEIDKRLIFLMVRLANVEASLDAVEKKLGVNTRQQAAKAGDAKRAELGNEMMDRKGGGPVKWSQFYGRTAEKFFYHPTQNHTYHTQTVLSQQSPAADNQLEPGVPSRQGLPVHQRPPQFDYIYKANRDAQGRADQEVQQLRNKVDALQARRRQLEDEQAGLWCQVAFRAVTRYELTRKPVYRFEPLPASMDTAARQQADAVKAAALFVRQSLSIIDEAEQDQAKAFGSVKLVVADARDKFDDALIPLDTLTENTTNLKSAIGRFSALAGKLKDVADNLSDSYEVALDGDRFKDEVRKETFRGLLQESLVDYAQIVLALNEMAVMMGEEWRTKPDVNSPLKFVSLALPEPVSRSSSPASSPNDIPLPETTPGRPIKEASPARVPVAKGTPLEGEWQSISEELNGQPFNRTNGTRQFKFSGDSMFMSRIEKAYGTYQGSFHVDQESGHFDFNGRRGPSGDPVEFRGLYKIDGDSLILCYKYVKGDQTTRPVDFRTDDQAGTAFMLIRLKRFRGKPQAAPQKSPPTSIDSTAAIGDPFQRGSVWTGKTKNGSDTMTLSILERDGTSFTARFEGVVSKMNRLVKGTVKGNKLFWLSRDVQGTGRGGDNYGTIVSDDSGHRIDFEWHDTAKGVSGSFTLRLAQ